ncbi:MAG TPA: GNAT family N-acetyltransferase [Streptosporangiaceae bacterium]
MQSGLGPADMMSRDLVLADAGELKVSQFGRLQQIYEESFPSELRVPVAELAAASPRDRMLVALESGEPVGFAALRLLTGPSWAFLRYYGIAAGRRRSGLGLRFWHLVVPAMIDVGWPARIALEAEDPADAAGDPAEQEVRRARIGFWTRCGAVALPVPGYVMPAFTDTGRAEPMVLMAFDPAASGPSLADVTDLVRAIFIEHYGLLSSNPIVTAALDSIATGNG